MGAPRTGRIHYRTVFAGRLCQGRDVWLEARNNPVFGTDGIALLIAKFASDINAQIHRHQAEKASVKTAYDVST